jgi:glycosyltransferase involved in cell wall biosynthesis
MLQQIRVDDIACQVKQEENLEKIGFFFRSLSNIDQNCAKEILFKIGMESLTGKLLREPFAKKQKNFISEISQIDIPAAKSLSEKRQKIALVIPLFNEEKQVPIILRDLFDFVDIAIVVDDGSKDATSKEAAKLGAIVVRNAKNQGLIPALLVGLKETINQNADIVVLDMFPWVSRLSIPKLIRPIMTQNADLVVGMHNRLQEFFPSHTTPDHIPNHAQALNRKAVEKFLKYLPSNHFADRHTLNSTQFLFSKMLRVKEVEIKMLLPPLEIYRLLGSRQIAVRSREFNLGIQNLLG